METGGASNTAKKNRIAGGNSGRRDGTGNAVVGWYESSDGRRRGSKAWETPWMYVSVGMCNAMRWQVREYGLTVGAKVLLHEDACGRQKGAGCLVCDGPKRREVVGQGRRLFRAAWGLLVVGGYTGRRRRRRRCGRMDMPGPSTGVEYTVLCLCESHGEPLCCVRRQTRRSETGREEEREVPRGGGEVAPRDTTTGRRLE